MQEYVYVDILFLINFSMDYLCLYISAKILGYAFSAKRFVLAALIGGAYAAASLFLPLSHGIGSLVDVLMCPLICAVALHKRGEIRRTLFFSLLFFLISMLLGGVMTALFNLINKLSLPLDMLGGDGLSVWAFALLAILAALISLFGGSLIFKKREVRTCNIRIIFNGKELTLRGLCDSGNLVKDPISGTPVIIVDSARAGSIVDPRITEAFLHGEHPSSPAYSSMRLAPIATVSGRSTLVLLLPDSLEISYEHKNKTYTHTPRAYFALAEISSSAEGCDAIVPYSLIRG